MIWQQSGKHFGRIPDFRILQRVLLRVRDSGGTEIRGERLQDNATVRDGQFTTGSPDVDRHCGSDKRILCRYPEKYADSGKYFSRSLLLSARNVYRSTLYVLLQLAVQHHTCTRR